MAYPNSSDKKYAGVAIITYKTIATRNDVLEYFEQRGNPIEINK